MDYQELKRGWDKAAITNANAAIHPAGAHSKEAYQESAYADIRRLKEAIDLTSLYSNPYGPWPPLTIIDFGCGNGRMSVPLSEVFTHVYAVDMSYSMLQQIPATAANITRVLSVDNEFTLPDNTLADIAVSVSVFIHNTYAMGKQIMQQIAANLKPGGYAFLQIPIYSAPKEPSNWTDVGVWNTAMLQEAANESGLEVHSICANEGYFSFEKVGRLHNEYQILRKPNVLKDEIEEEGTIRYIALTTPTFPKGGPLEYDTKGFPHNPDNPEPEQQKENENFAKKTPTGSKR